jgi:hypothetical protein
MKSESAKRNRATVVDAQVESSNLIPGSKTGRWASAIPPYVRSATCRSRLPVRSSRRTTRRSVVEAYYEALAVYLDAELEPLELELGRKWREKVADGRRSTP